MAPRCERGISTGGADQCRTRVWRGCFARRRCFSLIIHQKLSVVLARDIFHVADEAVLCAIGCHTTLRANAAVLDKVLFVAEKIKWDQPGLPPCKADLLAALEESLDQAVFYYLCMMWAHCRTLRVIHPWLRAAYEQLSESATLTQTG